MPELSKMPEIEDLSGTKYLDNPEFQAALARSLGNNDDYDSPWKLALDKYLEEFLDFYFPQISQQIDWSIEPKSLDSEFQAVVKDSELGRNRADKLVEVSLLAGEKRWLNIHIEVQSQKDSSFEQRMFTYFYRIFDKYKEAPLSLAVLADTNSRWQPKSFELDIFESSLKFNFMRVKLLDYETKLEDLTKSDNAFSLLTAAHLITKRTKKNPQARKKNKLTLVHLLYSNGWDKQKILDFFAILDWLMQLPPLDEIAFNQQARKILRGKDMQYVTSVERIATLSALFQGREEGKLETALNLRDKLGLTTEKIAEVLEMPIDKLNEYLKAKSK